MRPPGPVPALLLALWAGAPAAGDPAGCSARALARLRHGDRQVERAARALGRMTDGERGLRRRSALARPAAVASTGLPPLEWLPALRGGAAGRDQILLRRIGLEDLSGRRHRVYAVLPRDPRGGARPTSAWAERLLDVQPSVLLGLLDVLVLRAGPHRETPSVVAETHVVDGALHGDRTVVDIFPRGWGDSFEEASDHLRHELGHLASLGTYGQATPGRTWAAAMERDGRRVSAYGATSPSEDFAESAVLYVGSAGGDSRPAPRAEFPNRFRVLEAALDLLAHGE